MHFDNFVLKNILVVRRPKYLRVFKGRVLRRIFGPRSEEVAGGWRRLHNEMLHNFYASPNVIRVIKSRRVEWGTCSTREKNEKCIQNSRQKT
jgi:hypothetical protein